MRRRRGPATAWELRGDGGEVTASGVGAIDGVGDERRGVVASSGGRRARERRGEEAMATWSSGGGGTAPEVANNDGVAAPDPDRGEVERVGSGGWGAVRVSGGIRGVGAAGWASGSAWLARWPAGPRPGGAGSFFCFV